jgi:hypothetical protein
MQHEPALDFFARCRFVLCKTVVCGGFRAFATFRFFRGFQSAPVEKSLVTELFDQPALLQFLKDLL